MFSIHLALALALLFFWFSPSEAGFRFDLSSVLARLMLLNNTLLMMFAIPRSRVFYIINFNNMKSKI